MTLWPKVAKHSVVLSIEATVAPTSGVVVACSRRSPLLTECDQHTRSSGADSNNRLLPSRRILLSSVVLAAGAIAAWNLRKQHVDLHADNSQAQSRTGRGAVAYRGQQDSQQTTKRTAIKSVVRPGGRSFHSLFATMNTSHADLISKLRQTERLTDKSAQAMLQVDRKFFLDPDNESVAHLAYEDHPVPIGYGETISAPHMHAEALKLLEQHCYHGASVLDVGSGSGYLTGCLGILVGDSGQVLGVEKHKELAHRSIQSLQQAVPALMGKSTIKIMPGNVLGRVLAEYGPFDAIHVGAAAATMPQNLIQKLKPGGRMVIPVGSQNALQVLKLVDKDQAGNVHEQDLMGVAYVPLTEPGMDPFVGKDEE